MKELFILAGLLVIIIPVSTYWGILAKKIVDDKELTNDTGINVELCQSKYGSNYPICS